MPSSSRAFSVRAFSVIVPVYNGARVIERCLDALAAQTAPAGSFELIVVDDGSTDGTAAVVSRWAAAHPHLPLRLVSQPNRGASTARNHGAQLATTPLLFFTDADCAPAPGWAAAFVAAFAGPDAPAGAMGAYGGAQATPAAAFAQLEFEERYARMRRRPSIAVASTYAAAYRRDVFWAAGGFDPAIPDNEDTELAYRVSTQGHRLVFVPEAIVHQEHDPTWIGYLRTKAQRGYWRTLVYRRFPGKAVRDSYTPQLLKLQMPLAPAALGGLLWAAAARAPRRMLLALPFLASTLPMLRFALHQKSPAAPWVPWGSLLRALAFVIGVSRALLVRRIPETRRPLPAENGATEPSATESVQPAAAPARHPLEEAA